MVRSGDILWLTMEPHFNAPSPFPASLCSHCSRHHHPTPSSAILRWSGDGSECRGLIPAFRSGSLAHRLLWCWERETREWEGKTYFHTTPPSSKTAQSFYSVLCFFVLASARGTHVCVREEPRIHREAIRLLRVLFLPKLLSSVKSLMIYFISLDQWEFTPINHYSFPFIINCVSLCWAKNKVPHTSHVFKST